MKDSEIAMPNIFKKLMNAISSAFVVLILSLLISCGGVGNGGSDAYCSANFVQGGVGMRVTFLVGSLNEFQFQVCYNDTYAGSEVSVYGVQLESDIASISTATDVRLAHLTDGLRPGDSFSVTFNGSDAWFVIYKDDNLGNFSTTTEILRGEFR